MPSVGTTGPFSRSDRLLDSKDFRRVLRRGRRRAHAELVVVTAPYRENPRESNNLRLDHGVRSRLGITASRKVGNAVVRNRFKRRVREWYRHHRGELERDMDLVVIARRSGARLDATALEARLGELLGLPDRGRSDG